MKKNLTSLFYTLLCFVILTILVSLIFSILYYLGLFISYLELLSKLFGYVIFIICAFLLGKNIKERTFFYAFGFAFIGFIIGFIFIDKNLTEIMLLFSKWILFVIISLISRNI